MKSTHLFLAFAGLLLAGCSQAPEFQVRLNQVGFRPLQEKTATIDVPSADAAPCEVTINWNVTLFALTAGLDALQ